MANRILSIEIGSQITHVIETDFKVKNPKIYKSFSFETPEGMFKGEELEDREGFREKLLEKLAEHKIKTKRVIFVLASSRIASRDVVIPMVKENQILPLLYANSAEYFPVDLQQYQLVYRTIGEVEEDGEKKHKLMVLAVPQDMLVTYQKLAADCELQLGGLDYIGNAATQILTDKIPHKLYAAVRIEDDNTLVTIMKDGMIELQRNFTYGIEDTVGVIQRSEQFEGEQTFEQALEILRTKSFTEETEENEDNDLADDLTETFRAIIGNVSRVINFYSSNHAGAAMESILLYGMGADVLDLAEALKKELSAPVLSDELKGVLVRDKSDVNKHFYPLAYACCLGAVIDPMDFRLREEDKKKHRGKKEKERTKGEKQKVQFTAEGFLKGCIVAAVVLLLAVLPYHFVLKYQIHQMTEEKAQKQHLADIYTQYKTAQKECNDIKTLYRSTETTSEGIGAFILELEEKMPSNIAVKSLTSDSAAIVMDFNVKTKREAAKVIDEMGKFDSIASVEVQSLEEIKDELNNTTVNCVISCTYVNGTQIEEEQETSVEEDVEALNNSNTSN